MATNEVDFSVRVYTTQVPIDKPGAELNYKGLICVNKYFYRTEYSPYPLKDESARDTMRTELIEKAKTKAAELSANAIVGMRIETCENMFVSKHNNFYQTIEMVFYGTAVYYFRTKDE